MPELLGDSEYHTGYMEEWHLGDEIYAQHGFEVCKSIEGHYTTECGPGRERNERSAYHYFLTQLGYKPGAGGTFSRRFCTRLPVEHSKPAFLASEASRFILANRAAPWILFLSFLEPHPPYGSVLDDPHAEAETPLPANYPGIPASGEPEWYKRHRAQVAPDQSRAAFQRATGNYAGLCAMVDQAVHRSLFRYSPSLASLRW